MKKIYLMILICITLFFSACGTKVVNEIYNVTFEGTINVSEFETLTKTVIKKTEDSVLTVFNYVYSFGGLNSQGSGSAVVYENVAILKNGETVDAKEAIENNLTVKKFIYRAITNKHVIENSDILKVVCNGDTEEINAKLIAFDEVIDLAIISFETIKYFPEIEIADSELLEKGSFVLAIGSPYGFEFNGSVSFGIVSYPKRYVEEEYKNKLIKNEYIQHDASINSGNSGGALVNLEGKLVGINTMKLAYENDNTEGMGFAIPSNLVMEFINENK